MMKRRHCLICSIIAMLSIVSYACETEYATCEGCEITDDSSGNEQTQTCKNGAQRCAENLESNESCKNGKWEDGEKCTYCFNENTSNEGVKKVDCGKCIPNSYKNAETEVCYKGDFRKFESKEISDGNSTSSVVLNPESAGKDALWELAFNESVTESGSFEYYNCHDAGVFGDMKSHEDAWKVVDEKSCCEENDYYIKRTGYKYYSVEVCRKVEFKEGIEADFLAYKYTGELNDSLIGKKKNLPYSLCYDGDLLIANNKNISKNQYLVYKSFECPSNYGCNEKYDELCFADGVKYDDEKGFECKFESNLITAFGGESITYDGQSIAKCPSGTLLKIQNEDGSLSGCGNQKFKLNQARCIPLDIKVGTSSAAAK